jgi:hypothetical protein
MGHIPLMVLVSLTRVVVPTVDFPFKYELFFCTRSLIFLPPFITNIQINAFETWKINTNVFLYNPIEHHLYAMKHKICEINETCVKAYT